MAITYTAVGVISGLLGADIQTAMQNPWVLSTFGIMFFALAISLFGYYELQLPAKWQSKINSASDNAQGKGILGTAIMGFLISLYNRSLCSSSTSWCCYFYISNR